jgi:hypothetical protein
LRHVSESAKLASATRQRDFATPTAYRIAVAVAALADTAKQYLFYDTPVAGNETQSLTIGISLAASDVIRVYNTLATLSFSVFGVELT